MQISPIQANIAAQAIFNFESGSGLLDVFASILEIFPLFPSVPVTEEWTWVVNVMTNYLGVETRIALMPNPRISIEFSVGGVDEQKRRLMYGLLASNIKVLSVMPLYQYAAPVTQRTLAGETRIYFDPALCNARVGELVVAINRVTQVVQTGEVATLETDGVTLLAAMGTTMNPDGVWAIAPAIQTLLDDDSGVQFGTKAGEIRISASSIKDETLQRPGSTQTIATYDSLPVVEKTFSAGTQESFSYRREIMDGGVGIRSARSADTSLVVDRRVEFFIDRLTDEVDYWRELFATLKGPQKTFLLSTQLQDLSLSIPHTDGASLLLINEFSYETKLFPYDTFKRLKISYTDGTFSYHTVVVAETVAGQARISLDSTLDPGKTLTRISFLQKVRAGPRVKLQHYADYSKISFGVRTINT